MSSNRRRVLAIVPLPKSVVEQLAERYDLLYQPSGWTTASCGDYLRVEAVITNGTTGLSAEQIAKLPLLGLISAFGAGYEGIDLDAARARNIQATHAPGANDATVADHAIALALALARDIPRRDRAMRTGGWAQIRSPRPTLTGARVGVLGLGHVGRQIAKRAEAFGSRIAYNALAPEPKYPWQYHENPLRLAEESQFLFVACPGGDATRHLVNQSILRALGRDGFLINVARGSVVDTTALVRALAEGTIAGAGLDVYEHEPTVPKALLDLDNVICTPHMAGRSPDAENKQADLLMRNLEAFFASETLLTPIR